MSDDPDPVIVFLNLTYTITVFNNGPDFGANVSVTDTLPGGVQFVFASSTQGNCTGTSTITCNLGSVQTTASVSLTVKPTVSGPLSNTANVVYAGDPNPSNNSATVTTTVSGPATHFEVVAPSEVVMANEFQLTVRALDKFNNTAIGYTATMHFTSNDPSAALPADSTLTNGTGNFTATLNQPGNRTITATDTVNGSITGTSGPISVIFGGSTPTPTPAPPIDFAIAMADYPDPLRRGENIHYTISVSNPGPDFGVNVSMIDTLPDGATFVCASASQGGCTGTGPVTCNLGPVQSNATINLMVNAPQVPGQITNTATVPYSADPNQSNNTATEVTTVLQATPTPVSLSADIGVDITDSPDPVTVGQNLTYTITIHNFGPTLLPVQLTDNLPANVQFVSVNSSNACCKGPNPIVCYWDNRGVGALPVTLVVIPTVAGPLSNTVRAQGYGQDQNPGNNEATATTTVLPAGTPSPTPTPVSPTPTSTPTPTPIQPTPTPTPVSPTPTSTPVPATPTPTSTPTQALNLATRLRVQSGDNVGIGGFIITGNTSKTVAIRGIGPSLAGFGISDFLADPTLELRNSIGGLVKQNDNWQDDPGDAAQLIIRGLAPQDPKESGIVATLQSSAAYTAILAGKNQTSGVGLIEIYDVDQTTNSELANISTRGFVLTGNNVMIGGFILGGSNNTRVVVRGIGPSLAQFGLNPVLADPTLELHDSNGATLVSNNDWQDDSASAAQLTSLGLAPQNTKESAIAISLPPGAFTGILAGNNGGTGIGLIEIYNVH